MERQHRPKFSPMMLNILMLVCLVLIIILTYNPKDNSHSRLPPVPKINISLWQTDSGAKVWYSPMLADTIQVQLWYLAGFSHDDKHKGKAQLLAQLLKYESRKRQLDMDISLDQDFLKLSLALSPQPSVMMQQIKMAKALLYHPKLPNGLIAKLRSNHPSTSQVLLDALYPMHPYAGPKQGNSESLSQLTRKTLQDFQHSFMHPSRLHMSLVGDIDQPTAQIITENLLPASKHTAAKKTAINSLDVGFASNSHMQGFVWPSLKHSAQQKPHLSVDNYMLYQILNELHPKQIRFAPGLANSTLVISQSQQLQAVLGDKLDSEIIAQAKRKLLKQWLVQLRSAKGLSKHLVQLNAYGYAVTELDQRRNALMLWDEDRWTVLSEKLLAPLVANN